MSSSNTTLCANLKKLGFSQENQMRLYGQEFKFLSDPIVMPDGTVSVDAIEKRSRQTRRISVPLTIVHLASAENKADSGRSAA